MIFAFFFVMAAETSDAPSTRAAHDAEGRTESLRVLERASFMARFDAVQAHLLDSLEAEGTMLDSLKALSASAQRQALALEAALSVHQQDAALIASLRTRLAEAAGMVEAAAARERGAQEELSRERLALTAAAQRVEELAAQAEGLRQMIAAAPRPPRPQLSGAVQGGASDTPFERWRANAGLLRLEGVPRGRRRSLSPGTVRRLGHVTAVCAGGCGGACEGGCGGGGGGTALLGAGPIELEPHPFWSPQLYAERKVQGAGTGGGGSAGGCAVPPPPTCAAPPPQHPPHPLPQRLAPLLISHVSNLARHGDGGAQKWAGMLQEERARLAVTLAAVRDREAKVRLLRGGSGGLPAPQPTEACNG